MVDSIDATGLFSVSMSEPTRKLPHGAIGGIDGDAYQPLAAPGEQLREFTFRSAFGLGWRPDWGGHAWMGAAGPYVALALFLAFGFYMVRVAQRPATR
jgi:hypothetical protein